MLQPLQARFKQADHPNLLVGLEVPDDATVYRINDTQAIVQTVDFFSPVVDDPYWFGAIAAANSISDIYAMGGTPIFALNIFAVPDDLPPAIVAEIMRGGADKAAEAGIPIAGGHTVRDKEPKYGLTVTGLIEPAQVLAKGGARAGDQLVLTKPLGVGVLTTALKRERIAEADLAPATASMARLNRDAAAAAREAGARAGTDITGFGLAGHALEMATHSGTQFVFRYAALPWLPQALALGAQHIFPGGAGSNQVSAGSDVTFDAALAEWQQLMVHDPETSGGLLLPISPDRLPTLLDALARRAQPAWVVGEVRQGRGVHFAD